MDILANHAGVPSGGPIDQMTEAQWDRGIGVHLKGAFLCSKAVLPHMKAKGWGRIVSTGSRAAYRGMTTTSGLVADSGMSIGAPEPTEEELTARSVAEGQVLPPRYVRPDEIASAVLYLVGPGGDRMTGTVLHINGGSYFGG